jgi:hypothetical protein
MHWKTHDDFAQIFRNRQILFWWFHYSCMPLTDESEQGSKPSWNISGSKPFIMPTLFGAGTFMVYCAHADMCPSGKTGVSTNPAKSFGVFSSYLIAD